VDNQRLLRMANQIGAFFESYPDRAEAVAGVANHLRSFWAPVMRRQIIEYAAGGGGAEMKDIVRDAVAVLARETAARDAAGTGGEKRNF